MNARTTAGLVLFLTLGALAGLTVHYRQLHVSSQSQELAQLQQLEYDGNYDEVAGLRARVKIGNCQNQLHELLKTADPADENLACAQQNIKDGIRLLRQSDTIATDAAKSDEQLKADKATCTAILRLNRIAETHGDLAQVYIDRYSQNSK